MSDIWLNNFYRNGAHPGEAAAAEYAILSAGFTDAATATEIVAKALQPVEVRISSAPWPVHLPDLREHPGDVVLTVNVNSLLAAGDAARQHERNAALADAIMLAAQSEMRKIAEALRAATEALRAATEDRVPATRVHVMHYDPITGTLTHEPPTAIPTQTRCPECSLLGYSDMPCPRCAPQFPVMLRDECGACGQPCSNEWCPWCEGVTEGEQGANSSRMALQFATQQQQHLTQQLEHQARRYAALLGEMSTQRELSLQEVCGLRQRLHQTETALASTRSVINHHREAHAHLVRANVALHQHQAHARRTVRRIAVGVALGAGITLAARAAWWLWGPWLVQHAPPGGSWPLVAVALGALLAGMCWPRKSCSSPLTPPGGGGNTSPLEATSPGACPGPAIQAESRLERTPAPDSTG